MKKLLIGLIAFTSFSAFAECDSIKSAVDYIKTDPSFSHWIGGPITNIRFSNIPTSENPKEKQVLIVVDFKNEWSAGTLSNLILVDIQKCSSKLGWSANLHTVH